jgi:hypothetical protein
MGKRLEAARREMNRLEKGEKVFTVGIPPKPYDSHSILSRSLDDLAQLLMFVLEADDIYPGVSGILERIVNDED